MTGIIIRDTMRFWVQRSRFSVLGSGFAVLACAATLAAQTVNWPLHNLDLAGGRFSPMD
jgi:hypothetical protein